MLFTVPIEKKSRYRISEKQRATKTVNSERMALYNLFSILIEHNKISGINPVTKIRSLKVIKVQKRHCLSDEELSKFLEGAKTESMNINWYAIYLTLYIGGFRRDEIRTLEKSNVDLSKGLITIENTKTDKPRKIYIHPELNSTLQKAIAQAKGKYVFPDFKGNILNKNKMRNKMIEICEKVGIAKATLHDLRHTFASHPGLSSKTKQEIGGWSSKQVMEKTYNNPPEDVIRKEYCEAKFIPKPKA